jgi:hypothetical protein
LPPDSDPDSIPPKNSIFILGAGFSVSACLPTASQLWEEVVDRGLRMKGRADKFRADLDDYIEFKRRAEGVDIKLEEVNFEEFLGFLDIEHYLGLRGSETWSEDGNESQVIIKTLIGQVLTEKTPGRGKLPNLYTDFANKLQPNDFVYTFNYDLILEQACEAVNKPYRLFPHYSGDLLLHRRDEVIILKLHGSIDWFSRRSFRTALEQGHNNGFTDYVPHDAIFDPKNKFTPNAIKSQCDKGDILYDIYRIKNAERY